jgi:cysteine desulfurase
MFSFNTHKRIYLDHASATPVDPNVLQTYLDLSKLHFANPSALHKRGVAAKNALETSRITAAKLIGAHSNEIVFVSGATESDNLALQGVIKNFKQNYPTIRPHIILSAIEHAAVIETGEWFKEHEVDVSLLEVNHEGLVDPKALRKLIRPETILVSIMLANNEIGTILPITECAKEVRHARRHKDENSILDARYPLMHTDASQAYNYIDTNVTKLGVDLMTLSSSKIYGPKGTGLLYIKRGTPIESIMFGGDQEMGMRPGTESVPLVGAFVQALEIADQLRVTEADRLLKLREYLVLSLHQSQIRIRIYGSETERLPNNLNFAVSGYESEMLVIYLDAEGIEVSSKSACKSTEAEASHVIKALGTESNVEEGSIRVSMGRSTTKSDIDFLVASLKKVLSIIAK